MTPKEVLAPLMALAGERETGSGNNTTVNKYYNAVGSAYCGFSIRYAFEKSGNAAALKDSPNTAYVPTFRAFCKKYWQKIPNAQAAKGDVFIYKDQHEGFVFAPYSGATVITLEGNAFVYSTEAQAKAAATGSGLFEGIGYKKRYLTADYEIYRPPYDGSAEPEPAYVIDYGKEFTVRLNTLKVGSSGPQVKTVQRLLYARHIWSDNGAEVKVDGSYGAKTAQAVKRLQRELGVEDDGEWGQITAMAALTQLW